MPSFTSGGLRTNYNKSSIVENKACREPLNLPGRYTTSSSTAPGRRARAWSIYGWDLCVTNSENEGTGLAERISDKSDGDELTNESAD